MGRFLVSIKNKIFIGVVSISFFLCYQNIIAKSFNTLSLSYPADISGFDPIKVDDIYSINANLQIYEGLFGYNQYGEIIPILAAKWQISGSGKKYRIEIKKGVKFHDGSSLTVDDVIFSLSRIADTAQGSINSWAITPLIEDSKNISKSLKKEDDYTFTITLKKEFPAFIDLLASPYMLILSKRAVQDNKMNPADNPIGTGAFKLKKHVAGKEILLDKFGEYHGIKSNIDSLHILIDVGYNRAIDWYNSSKTDLLILFNHNHAKRITRKKIWTVSVPQYTTWLLGFNHALGKLALNSKLRDAISYSIDKPKLVSILGNKDTPTAHYFPPGLLFKQKHNFKPTYNKELARRLLSESKLPPNFSITLSLFDNLQNLSPLQEFFKETFESISLKVKIKVQPFNDFIQSLINGDHEMFLIQVLPGYADPDSMAYPYLHSNGMANILKLNSPILDSILEKARYDMNTENRVNLYKQADDLLTTNSLLIPLYHENATISLNDKYNKDTIQDFSVWYIKFKNIQLKE